MSAIFANGGFLTTSLAMTLYGAFLSVVLITAAVQAQSPEEAATARSMLESCKTQTDAGTEAQHWALCTGRIQGWMVAHYMSHLAYGGATRRLYCEPSDWTVKQVAAAFVKWGAEHPELLNLSWNNGLLKALQDAFPCPPRD